MAALTAGTQRPSQSDPKYKQAPIADNVIQYQGGLVMLDTSGRAQPPGNSAGAFCAGVALPRDRDLDRYDNTVSGHAAGALTVEFYEGTFGFLNDGGSPILATTQPGTILYAVDDQTVSLSSSGGTRPVAGRLVTLDSTVIGGPVVVEVSELIGAQATTQIATLTVGGGGTGDTTLAAHGVLIGEGTSAVGAVAPSATVGVPLMSQGASADPAYTGQVPIANGGTGAATASANQAFIGPASGAAAAPSFRALGAGDVPLACFHVGAGVAGHNGAGALTLAAAKIGDKVLMASYTGATPPTSDPLSALEATVSVNGQVQQTDAANLSAGHFSILLLALS